MIRSQIYNLHSIFKGNRTKTFMRCLYLQKAPKMIESIVEKGIEACRSNDFKKGIELFNQALNQNPNHAAALYNRARALSKNEQLTEALSDFKRLVELHPENATFISDFAVALHLNNRNDEALTQFDLALKLEPQNPYRWSSRAFFKDRIGQSKEALADYEKALELDPDDAITLNNKGLIEEKLGYIERSKKSFNRSNELVGYSPGTGKPMERPSAPTPSAEKPKQEPLTRWKVIKSVFTKEGFKDFSNFTKTKVLRRKA
tara:strand:+ start:1284 stop:2063 length:780 start_codon:yes stop_codon:yes gene_type:complete